MTILSGPLAGWRWINGAGTPDSWLGTFDGDTQRLFRRHVHTGGVVYDIGAQAGFFTLLASRLVGPTGRVIAFEPLPRNVHLLERHLRLNEVTNVTALALAVSTNRGKAHLATTTGPGIARVEADGAVEVPADSLDGIFRERRLPPPDFIRIDVEGGENAVLSGGLAMLREIRPMILMSTHGYEQHQSCWTLLTQLGYRLEVRRDGTADGNYVILAHAS